MDEPVANQYEDEPVFECSAAWPAVDQQQDDSSTSSDVEMPAAAVRGRRTRGVARGRGRSGELGQGRGRGRGQAAADVVVEPGWHKFGYISIIVMCT